MVLTDVARKWRVPEFVGLVLLIAVVLLIEASMQTYKQFIPPVSTNYDFADFGPPRVSAGAFG